MLSKRVLHERDQKRIIGEIVNILKLQEIPVYTLDDLDNRFDIQEKIMELSSEIKMFFNCNSLKAVTDPNRIKRPWLSIIKTLLKDEYQIITEDVHVKKEGKFIHTKQYTFIYLAA